MLYQITLSYACFGIIVENNIVVEAAPIGRWMIGKKLEMIQSRVEYKGGIIALVS